MLRCGATYFNLRFDEVPFASTLTSLGCTLTELSDCISLKRISNNENGVYGGTHSLFGAIQANTLAKTWEVMIQTEHILGYSRALSLHQSVFDGINLNGASDDSANISEAIEVPSKQAILSDKLRYHRKNNIGNVSVQSKRNHAETKSVSDMRLQVVSFWHASSQSIVNAIADVESEWLKNVPFHNGERKKVVKASPINVANGIVLLEVVDVKNWLVEFCWVRHLVWGVKPSNQGNEGWRRSYRKKLSVNRCSEIREFCQSNW